MIKKVYKVLPGSGIRIKQVGIFDFDGLYKGMKEWFSEHEYIFHEKEHTEKDLPQGREILMKWAAERDIDDYARFKIDVHFMIEKFTRLNGKAKAELKITYFAYMDLDYKNSWQRNALYKFLFFVYNNYIIKGKILTNYEIKLKKDVNDLRNIVKGYIE